MIYRSLPVIRAVSRLVARVPTIAQRPPRIKDT